MKGINFKNAGFSSIDELYDHIIRSYDDNYEDAARLYAKLTVDQRLDFYTHLTHAHIDKKTRVKPLVMVRKLNKI